MRIAFLAAGAAGMYCGSCLRDGVLASAMRSLGHEFILVPCYTPLRVEEEAGAEEHVFFGGIDVYLQQKFPSLRRKRGIGRIVGRLLGSQALLRSVSRFGLSTSPRHLGALTVSMLRGADGNQSRSLDELALWLASDVRPDVVHLSNLLFAGFARELKRRLGVPVLAGLQGEDFFLSGLPEPHRSTAFGLIRERAADVDRFIATSADQAARAPRWAAADPSRIDVVHPGISLAGYDDAPAGRGPRPPTIGYFARISPEKGLHVLAAAFARLSAQGEFPGLRLKVAGYLGPRERRYAAAVRRELARAGLSSAVEILGTMDRAGKLAFLREVDVLSVPTSIPEPKGIFLLESLAAGVPVVEPAQGSFPELIEATGGGLLCEPGDSDDLAEKLAVLLRDPDLRTRLGETGRAAVRERFGSRSMAEATLEVYRKVLPVSVK